MSTSRAFLRLLVLGAVGLVGGSCASAQRPVLYPNGYLETVGKAQAEADIDACMEFAAGQVEKYRRGELVLEDGAQGAVAGAAGGAAVGVVRGGSVGRSAGAGAAAGLAVGMVRGLWSSSEPDPIFKNFVDTCLIEKGYRPQGWR